MSYNIPKKKRGYKQRLKYLVGEELSDKNLKNVEDWRITHQPLKKGYRARETTITLIPKRK